MTEQEIKFINFWEENLKGKVQVDTELILQAQEILTGIRTHTRCASCLSKIGQELKDTYNNLKNNK